MRPFFKFGLLLPWKGLPADLSISPWRRCTHQRICKQVGTLWRQTQYHTICTPTHTRLLPYSSLSIPHFKAERPRWRFGKKWKTNCSFVSGRRPDTWANFLCILTPLHWSCVEGLHRGARQIQGPCNLLFKGLRLANKGVKELVNDHLQDKSLEMLYYNTVVPNLWYAHV